MTELEKNDKLKIDPRVHSYRIDTPSCNLHIDEPRECVDPITQEFDEMLRQVRNVPSLRVAMADGCGEVYQTRGMKIFEVGIAA